MEGAPQPPTESTETLECREALPNEAWLTPWRDEVVEAVGFGPRSMYVEMCWLPVLGPTSTWLYRRLGSWAEFNPEGTTVNLVDLAVSLGLGDSLTKNSKLNHAIERLARFDALHCTNSSELQVRTALAPLPGRHLERLSYASRRLHDELTRRPPSTLPGQGTNGAAT